MYVFQLFSTGQSNLKECDMVVIIYNLSGNMRHINTFFYNLKGAVVVVIVW